VWYKGTGAIITDGFTVTWLSGLAPPAAINFMSLCLEGPAQVGSWNKTMAAATTTDKITTNPGSTNITPVAVFTTNRCATSSTSSSAGYRLTVGGSDGTNNGSVIATDQNGVATDVVYKSNNPYDSILVANSDTQVYDAVASIGNFVSGSFTATWTTNNSVATQICYIAIGY
jgi:hypothetical protein